MMRARHMTRSRRDAPRFCLPMRRLIALKQATIITALSSDEEEEKQQQLPPKRKDLEHAAFCGRTRTK